MNIAVKFIVYAGLLYVGYVAFFFLMQTSLVFPRSMIPRYDLAPPKASVRTLLQTSFGRVEAWYLPPEGPVSGPVPAVIFAHGNAELIDFWPQDLGHFRQLGMGVLLVEYPGYGRSEGTPSERTITEAFTAGYDWLTARNDVDGQRIILFGRSIGGGVVCALARQRPTAGLILMSTFTSVNSMAARYLFPSPLLKTRFDNLSVLTSFDRPVLIIHGTRDAIVPYRHARELHSAGPTTTLLTLDCGHNDCPLGSRIVRNGIERFLERTVLPIREQNQ
jgi:uncharacterized protein